MIAEKKKRQKSWDLKGHVDFMELLWIATTIALAVWLLPDVDYKEFEYVPCGIP